MLVLVESVDFYQEGKVVKNCNNRSEVRMRLTSGGPHGDCSGHTEDTKFDGTSFDDVSVISLKVTWW